MNLDALTPSTLTNTRVALILRRFQGRCLEAHERSLSGGEPIGARACACGCPTESGPGTGACALLAALQGPVEPAEWLATAQALSRALGAPDGPSAA